MLIAHVIGLTTSRYARGNQFISTAPMGAALGASLVRSIFRRFRTQEAPHGVFGQADINGQFSDTVSSVMFYLVEIYKYLFTTISRQIYAPISPTLHRGSLHR